MGRLAGQRILIVGASSGIGYALAGVAAGEGARLAVAARRRDRLEALAEELGDAVLPVTCDVADPTSCEAVVETAASVLGGLDALVYATGLAMLRRVSESDHADWLRCLEVNLVGASLVTRAALPYLVESRGRAVYLSSISADDEPPRRGLGLYLTAKTALNKLVEVWQSEHPEVSFTRVSVGDTGATDMAAEWDVAEAQSVVQEWIAGGYLYGRAMEPAAVGRHLVDVLASEETIGVTRITPRRASD